MWTRIFAFILVLAAAVPSMAQGKIDLFGGYSYARPSIEVQPTGPLTPCPPNCSPPSPVTQSANLSGWEFSGTYKVTGPLRLVGDFGGEYGSLNGGSTHLITYLAGPQLSFPSRVSPFVHGLFGGAHESVNTSFAFFPLGSSNSVAFAIGGGVDVKAARFVSIRLIQIDYVYTHLYGRSQSEPRVSAGFVFHFGAPNIFR